MAPRSINESFAIKEAVEEYAKRNEGKFYSLTQIANYVSGKLGFTPNKMTIKARLSDAGYTFQRGRYVKK